MQRMRVRLLGRFARRILPVIRKGFAGVGKGTAYNAFMAANMKQVTVDEDMTGSIDFETLQLASGLLYTPRVEVTCEEDPVVYRFVQTAEEGGEYYLYRDIDGSSNKNGTVFLDWRCNSDFTSQNNLIYGHNMKTGRMFAPIVKYRDQSFYDAHPYMYLYTPNQLYKVNLFAGMVTPHDSTVYSYSLSADYIKQCIASSTFKSSVGTPTGNILTLSTCAYDYDNARYVVMGELVPIDWPS